MKGLFRKFIGLIIAPLGAFSIIGSGFAFWDFGFGSTIVDLSEDGGVEVTPLVNVGEITINQCPDLLVFSTGTLGNESLFDGITFYTDISFEHGGENYTETTNDSTFSFTYTYADNNLANPQTMGYVLNLGLCLELNSNGQTSNGATSYLMSDYLSIVDAITNSNFNISRNNHNYFVLNSTDDSYDYASTSLSFKIETNTTTNEPYTIKVSFALNQFLRYKNSSVKPIDLDTYKTITDAAKKGQWKFSIYLTAFFTEYVGGISI